MTPSNAHEEIVKVHQEACIADRNHALRKGRPVDRDDIARWLSVADDELMSDLDWLSGDFRVPFTPEAENHLYAALIPYFIASGTNGTPQMEYFEVLESMKCMFHRLWTAPHRRLDLLQQVKDGFAKLASISESDAEYIVCAVLEHIFTTPGVQEFFSDWRAAPQLRSAFDEGVWIAGSGGI